MEGEAMSYSPYIIRSISQCKILFNIDGVI